MDKVLEVLVGALRTILLALVFWLIVMVLAGLLAPALGQ